ncbi:hypothetical protein Dimus_015220 [Dionaea muscipula]
MDRVFLKYGSRHACCSFGAAARPELAARPEPLAAPSSLLAKSHAGRRLHGLTAREESWPQRASAAYEGSSLAARASSAGRNHQLLVWEGKHPQAPLLATPLVARRGRYPPCSLVVYDGDGHCPGLSHSSREAAVHGHQFLVSADAKFEALIGAEE